MWVCTEWHFLIGKLIVIFSSPAAVFPRDPRTSPLFPFYEATVLITWGKKKKKEPLNERICEPPVHISLSTTPQRFKLERFLDASVRVCMSIVHIIACWAFSLSIENKQFSYTLSSLASKRAIYVPIRRTYPRDESWSWWTCSGV